MNDNIKVIANEIVKLITIKVCLNLFEYFWRRALIGQVPNFRVWWSKQTFTVIKKKGILTSQFIEYTSEGKHKVIYLKKV